MKLFHTENDKESVYVQMQDIQYLKQTNLSIPETIYSKILTDIDDSNRFDFVKFDEPMEVTFFKELEFILDYNQYKDLTDKQLEQKAHELTKKINKITEAWNFMSTNMHQENIHLFEKYKNLMYMLQFLSEIYAIKHGKLFIPFPDFITPLAPPKRRWFPGRKKDN